MPAVNWDQPSTGLVSDAAPSLQLENDKGGALQARSREVAVDAESKEAEALRARTGNTLAAHIRSEEFVGAIAFGPRATGAIGVNEAAAVAVGGVNLVDPAQPVDSLDGIGVAGISNRQAAYGVVGATLGVRSTGVLGHAQGGGVGVRGIGPKGGVEGSSAQGHGVAGTSQSKGFAGVFGFAPGPQRGGVVGQSTAGAGVDGSSSAGTGVRGASVQAHGVVGESTGGNAAGVSGRNDLGSGVGVDGFSNAGTAMRATSGSGTGLLVETFSGTGIDVSNNSTRKPAITSYSLGRPALEAMSLVDAAVRADSIHAGVVATTIAAPDENDPRPAARCSVWRWEGRCLRPDHDRHRRARGRLSAARRLGRTLRRQRPHRRHPAQVRLLFSIDHPLDPKRKVLNHASVESPEYKTFYDGTAVLDRRGQATIRLPRWFDALNHELRYQVTAIGAPAPDLHVAREAAKGSFVIAGGGPRQRVCWQITGLRKDAWARAHPLQVEQPRDQARSQASAATLADVRRAAAAAEKKAKALRAREKSQDKAPRTRTAVKLERPEPPRRLDEDATTRMARRMLRDVERASAKPGA